MATIRKRGDLQWEARVRHKGHPTQSKTFCTKAEAEAWAAVIESEMARGVFISRTEAERVTLADCLKRYLAEVTPTKRSAYSESCRIGTLLQHPLSQAYMAAVRGTDLAKYRDDRLKEVSGATVTRELTIIGHVFNVARREWGMESLSNPVSAIRKPRQPQGRDRRLHEGELERLLAASHSPELKAAVLLALETGMRRSELTGLLWRRVNLKKAVISLDETKNGESRAVPLSSTAVRVLESMPRRLDGRVFGLTGESLSQAFERARDRARDAYLKECEATGLRPSAELLVDLRLHDLRHEAASRFFEKGLNVMEAAAITGHRDLRMLKRYTHLRAEDLAKKLG